MKYKYRGRINRRKRVIAKRFKQVKHLINAFYNLHMQFHMSRERAKEMADILDTYQIGGVMPNENLNK